MMYSDHFKLAWKSIRGAKTRSALTMFGIVIGTASVITLVSLGEGVKQQVAGEIQQLGNNLIVVEPGRKQALSSGIGSLFGNDRVSAGPLTETDVTAVAKTSGVMKVAPIAVVSGIPSYGDTTYEEVTVLASNEHLTDLLKQDVAFGGYFSPGELNRNFAVIGQAVALGLFGENVPIGKNFSLRGQEFLVTGVFDKTANDDLSYGVDFDHSVVLPMGSAKQLGATQIFEILARFDEQTNPETVANNVTSSLKQSRGGEDFSVLRQKDTASATDSIFYQVTLFVGGVALISLLVGGIGIMNIMFATVSERTHEIGIRKAIGATNRQILDQFMMEAVLISLVGCIVGILVSLITNGVLRLTTDLQPAITLPIMAIAGAIALVIGVISGILPAAKASRKDPIESLRYDQ